MKKCGGYPLIKCGNLLTSLKTGPFGSALKTEHWTTNGTAVLTIGSLGEQSIIEDELLYISDSYAEKLNPYRVNEGDIVFSRVADIGRAQLIDKKQDGWVISSNLMKMTINKELIRPAFLYIAIKDSPVVAGQLKSHSNGNGRLLVNSSIVKSIKIPTPELAVQDKLIDIISCWDNAIEKTEALIAAKEKQFEWLCTNLLSKRKKSFGFTGKSIPTAFGSIFSLFKKVNTSCADYEVLSVTKEGIVSQSEYFNKEVASKDKSKYLIVDKYTLVMSGLNFWMGAIDFQTIRDTGIVSPAYKTFKLNEGPYNRDYLRFFIRSHYMTRILLDSSIQGASIVRRNLDMEWLSNSLIDLPNLEEQNDIANILSLAEKEIDGLKLLTEKYRSQKRGLMQKLLTGEWQVCCAQPVAEGALQELTKEVSA